MKKNHITFFLGGCRSGKSRAALEAAEALGAKRRIYVATCRPADEERHAAAPRITMRRRVARHQAERGERWETHEEPVAIARLIRRQSGPQTVLLVDCLTLWLTNLITGGADDDGLLGAIDELTCALGAARGPVLLVANEVGLGIVPGNALSRRFRDWAGTLNQDVARCADTVWLVVAGIPVALKPCAPGEGPP